MAELTIHTRKIKDNISYISRFLKHHHIHWSLITKVFAGDTRFLEHVLTPDILAKIDSIGDSRLSNLKNLKAFNPKIKTIYIKPPAEIYAEDVVKYADISLNSSLSTILALNRAAKKAKKIHQVIIMIEMGELREGINRSQIMDFYEKVFNLSNIEVIGIGSNLGCMYGVIPTYDKLLQLSLYKELISAKFDHELSLISGGTSITLPLIERGQIPPEINHFRIGEAAFFGISPFDNEKFNELQTDTFEFHANIIELEKKKIVPEGIIADANVGHATTFDTNKGNETSYKAILDFGMLDVDQENISQIGTDLAFVGITSDMIVVDLGQNLTTEGKKKYHVGDKITFKPNYMAVARLLNSKYIEKVYVDE